MKLTKSKLQQLIKEELGRVLGEEETNISAEPIEGRVGVRTLINKALEIIKQTGGVGYVALENWLFQNHIVGGHAEEDWLSAAIERALENRSVRKYYSEVTHSFGKPKRLKLPSDKKKELFFKKWRQWNAELPSFVSDHYQRPLLSYNGVDEDEARDDYEGPDERLANIWKTMELVYEAGEGEDVSGVEEAKQGMIELLKSAKDDAELALLKDFVSFADRLQSEIEIRFQSL